MPKDYRFEILSILYNSEENIVNIRSYIMEELPKGIKSRVGFQDILRKLKKDEFIWYEDTSSLAVSFGGKYQDEIAVNARIEPKGIDEYLRLKKQYEPPIMPQPTTSIKDSILNIDSYIKDSQQSAGASSSQSNPATIPHKTATANKIIIGIIIGLVVLLIGHYVFRIG